MYWEQPMAWTGMPQGTLPGLKPCPCHAGNVRETITAHAAYGRACHVRLCASVATMCDMGLRGGSSQYHMVTNVRCAPLLPRS